jgi:arsenite methyltransferase
MDSEKIYHHVQEHYGSIAREKDITYSSVIANAFGYSEEELNSIPKDANLGLSCGNPLAIASIREV